MRIGIDVGGTHTDAVVLDDDRLVSAHKTPTTPDVAEGVAHALSRVLADIGTERAAIEAVMLGTTQFTNAVIERRGLNEVAAIRLGMPSGAELPPMIDWPADAVDAVGHNTYMLRGGYLYDGKELSVPSEPEIDSAIDDIAEKGLHSVAICSAFSPMVPKPEIRLAARLRRAIDGIQVTGSHQIGRLGLLERENATILNASLVDLASSVVDAFEGALRRHGLNCPFFISQNDGTLMRAEFARRYPALTIASGATNSIRGAAHLTGFNDAIVVDIGGTTSDIGVLCNGFPRESNHVITTGGIRTNFRMPDLVVVGLGGGSLVSDDGLRIGPRSVGHRLGAEAVVFGGNTLTATDVTVAAGEATVGDRSRTHHLPARLIAASRKTILGMLKTGIGRMAPGRAPLPVVVVGGGAVLAQQGVPGYETVRPDHADVANAIGAARATIGGEAERIVSLAKDDAKTARSRLTQLATERAVAAGADAITVRVVDIEEVPLAYMGEYGVRLKVKVVGDIAGIGPA